MFKQQVLEEESEQEEETYEEDEDGMDHDHHDEEGTTKVRSCLKPPFDSSVKFLLKLSSSLSKTRPSRTLSLSHLSPVLSSTSAPVKAIQLTSLLFLSQEEENTYTGHDDGLSGTLDRYFDLKTFFSIC